MNGGTDFTLTRQQVIGLLHELGADLESRGVHAQLFVVGGAAIALAFNTRRTTGDVDGTFEPKTVVYEVAQLIASRHEGMPPDWLNDGVKGLLPGPDPNARVILDLPGVTVSVASPSYLLALKVQAARIDRDEDDIHFLARLCEADTAAEVLAIAEGVIGRNRLLPKSQFMVQEMFPSVKPTLWRRFVAWAQVRARPTARSSTSPKALMPPRPPRCGGTTKSGKRCVLRAGHAGYHRGS